jgi:hypothetical protein
LIVFTATQDGTSNVGPAISARGDYDFLAIFTPVEPLNFPNVWLDTGILELLNRSHHQSGTNLRVVGLPISFNRIKLRFLCGYQQLEHEKTLTFRV